MIGWLRTRLVAWLLPEIKRQQEPSPAELAGIRAAVMYAAERALRETEADRAQQRIRP